MDIKELFKIFKTTDGSKVLLSNNLACKVSGIGIISIKMHNGIIKDLKQARIVPNLKRNLISLEMFDQLRCSIIVKNSDSSE